MNYILPLVLFLFIKFASSDSSYDVVREEWNLFKVQHSKKYAGSVEESYRFKIFVANLKKIYKHNQRYELGATLYKMDVNEFADMFEHEVLESRCGINGSTLSLNPTIGATFIPPANINIPTNFDWVKLGAVTEVKNQGHCGSCWAFSATGSLEGQNFRASKKLISLSEQNLMDCSRSYGNKGCKGGSMENAFLYIQHNNGIDTEEKYPYKAKDFIQCRYNPKFKGATIKGFVKLPEGSEDSLLKAVATICPISVAIEATSAFMFYKSGIFYDSHCSTSPSSVNHGVLVVGYGVDNATGENYWLVKNSWGPEWGDKGYIKMARNKRNNCNIATFGIFPIV